MNADEFLKWFGSELQGLIHATNLMNRFTASRDLVGRAINYLSEMPTKDRDRILDVLITSHQSRIIGDFRVPVDKRDESDTIEEILATIEAYLEN
jgi:hypothetical protein